MQYAVTSQVRLPLSLSALDTDRVPGTPLLIQLLANVPGKLVEDGQSAWATDPMWQTQRKLMSPCFSLAQPQSMWPLMEVAEIGVQRMEDYLSVSSSLTRILPFK